MDEPTETDESLMLRYARGDASAFETLYGRHRKPLFGYVLRQCRERALAEELFQDVWLRIVRAREPYDARAKFSTYLYRIARNRLIDHFRKRNPATVVLKDSEGAGLNDLPGDPANEPEPRAHLARQAERLLRTLDSLPLEQRETFLLREEAGLEITEIAEVTGVNPETAKSRLRYAVNKLRRILEEKS